LKMKWKQTPVRFILVITLLLLSTPLRAHAEEARSISSVTDEYQLAGSIKASVKGVLNEQVLEGTRIGAVVRLYNEGLRLTRVPDYEVRMKTEEGIEYTLRSSVANVIAIQPKEMAELSYMVVVDRNDVFSLSELSWVDVDDYVSPKLEKTVLSIPISSIEWKGEKSVFSDPAAVKKWGEPFAIPVLSTSLEYKPVSMIEQNSAKGSMTILELMATNNGDTKKTIPDFRIDGKTDKKVFNGKRLEQGTLSLDKGEQRYIHYAIPSGDGNELKSLTVLTSENFAADDKTNINYSIGQLSVTLPNDASAYRFKDQLQTYQWNLPIKFDPLNHVIQPEVSVSMVDLYMHESIGGYKAAVAKFKLQNRSDRPMTIPKFQAQLMGEGGNNYLGTRQKTEVETLIPNISYVLYYSFILPKTEKGDNLAMEILDSESVAPYNIPIAMFRTQVKPLKADNPLTFYPFDVKLNNWDVEVYLGSARENLYKLKLDMDISILDEVVVDTSFSKMKVELADANGKTIGSKTLPFTGENRLGSGSYTVSISSVQLEFTQRLRIYETIETPFGEVDRLIKILQR
jgi:hypothetical protein